MKKTFLWLFMIILAACSNPSSQESTEQSDNKSIAYYGNTQGTTYAVIVNDDIDLSMEEIDSTLHHFDLALSSYIPNSVLTGINESPAGAFEYQDEYGYFRRCYERSQEVYQLTNGAFDPTVYPLVDGWGFMKDIENVPDSATIDSLRSLLGFKNGYHFTYQKLKPEEDTVGAYTILKHTPNAKLDFNAIAQGLAVDVLAELIEQKGGKNYFVEIGGEIRVKGKNKDGVFWRIGIDKPIENSNQDDREIQEIVQLDNRSIATSGSYRKFYEKDGERYSHTLNPKTGYPVKHSLLSATVVSNSCAFADAMATALMVMGPDKGREFVQAHDTLDMEVYLIYENDKGRLETFYTAGFQELITE